MPAWLDRLRGKGEGKPEKKPIESVSAEETFTDQDWWTSYNIDMNDVFQFSTFRGKGLLIPKELQEVQDRLNKQLTEFGLKDLAVSIQEAFGVLVDVHLHEKWALEQPNRKPSLSIVDIAIWRHVNRLYRAQNSIDEKADLTEKQQQELRLWVDKFIKDRVDSQVLSPSADNSGLSVADDFEDLVKKQAFSLITRENKKRKREGREQLTPREEEEIAQQARKQCQDYLDGKD